MQGPYFRQFLVGFIVVFTLAMLVGQLPTTADSPKGDKAAEARKPGVKTTLATTETLGGNDRYLTHVSTDKPIYKPGETMHVRGVILHHATHKPLPQKANLAALIEVLGPKGDSVASGFVPSEDSVLGFSWKIPDEMAGGEYTAKVSYPGPGHPPAERKFDIRKYRPPRLKSQIKFVRDGYGPGDQVDATLHVERAEGGAPAGAKVTVLARVDGVETYRGTTSVDDEGDCAARFALPDEIVRGEGNLSMVIEDGGIVETASKTIPILLQTVDLTVYPEGGDLVAGLTNRVYFEAFTPTKKPADLAGVVLDSQEKKVVEFRSRHEGRGHFEFKPAAGEQYALAITEPSGIKTRFPLPTVKDNGVTLRSTQDAYSHSDPVVLLVASTQATKYVVTLAKREKIVANAQIDVASPGSASSVQPRETVKVKLNPPATADGVLVATVWDADGTPLAERLVFRQPARGVNVKVTSDIPRYVPGQKAKLTIETSDEDGEPVAAVVGLTVTDDSVLEMIDKREQAPRLPVMVLLENDVKELADAHVYLDPENPDAPQAIDLLLGTQGWRRFALVHPNKLMEEHGDLGRRAVALRIVPLHERRKVWKALRAMPLGAVEEGAIDLAVAAPADAPDVAAAPPEAAGQEKGHAEVAQFDDDKQPQGQAQPARQQGPPAGRELADADDVEEPVAAEEAILGKPLSKERKQLSQALEVSRRRANKDALLKEEDRALAIRNDFVPVRIYAHQVRSDRQPGQRTDFTETLFWHAGLKTDAAGKAEIEFGLNDSVTSFHVAADAFGADGALGGGTSRIESVEPFYVEPKIPLAVTAGDTIKLPIGFVNATPSKLDGTEVNITAHKSLTTAGTIARFDIAGDARLRRLIEIAVGKHSGPADLTIAARAGAFGDQVTRTIDIEPRGFPIEAGFGGLLAARGEAHHEIEIPDNLVAGSLKTRIAVYPTPLATMNEALTRLIREPSGCFEQTSSTNYPLVMAQQYFMSHEGVDPSLIEKSAKSLENGYQRLMGFECKGGGYEWFGEDPGHEALTAYGLMEFSDMAPVHAVDSEMIQRTRKWLLGTRDGKGSFTRKRRALHTWITEPECSNGYIAWALLEAGTSEDLSKEVQWIRDAGQRAHNTYAVALAANVLGLAGDDEGANHLLDKLSGHQQPDGSLDGATTSIVGSGGEALTIETTSLAVLAWLKNPRYAANVEQSIKYLAEVCKGGRFGSTQSTVLALKAIVAYDASRAVPKAPGAVQLLVDGQPIGQPVPFTTDTHGAIELPDASHLLTSGKHKLSLKMSDGSQMPYSVAVDYYSVKPNSSRDCKLHVEVSLNDTQVDEGAATEAHVVVVNRTNEPVPTPLAIVGVPGGLEVRHDQLKELVKAKKIAAYEVRGREVVLYWRSLKAEERVELPLSLVAAVPGSYTGPASRAYLYYTDEYKQWVDGLVVQINAKQ